MEPTPSRDPLATWKAHTTSEGVFTPGRVKAMEKILETYRDHLSMSRDNMDVWKAVEKVVKSINKLNKAEEHFIELTERETLTDYIQYEAEMAGVRFAGDITAEWRDEW